MGVTRGFWGAAFLAAMGCGGAPAASCPAGFDKQDGVCRIAVDGDNPGLEHADGGEKTCSLSAECGDSAPICSEQGVCEPCSTHKQCVDAGFFECSDAGTCTHECETDADCADPAAATCSETQNCEPCITDDACQHGGFDICGEGGVCVLTAKNIAPDTGELDPPFDPEILSYTLRLPIWQKTVTLTVDSEHSVQIGEGTDKAQQNTMAFDVPANETVDAVIIIAAGETTTSYLVQLERPVTTEAVAEQGDNETMGYALAANGNRMAAGSPTTDSVFVYSHDGTQWLRDKRLNRGTPGNRFGAAIALSGDVLAIGAPADQANKSGAVFIFEHGARGWTFARTVRPQGEDGEFASRGFGTSVDLSDDFLVVGSSTGSTIDSRGKNFPVQVFRRDQWSLEAELHEPNPGPEFVPILSHCDGLHCPWKGNAFGSGFGSSVAIDGEWLAIGAVGHDSAMGGINPDTAHGCQTPSISRLGTNRPVGSNENCADGSGAAFLFRRSNDKWVFETSIKSPTPTPLAGFGTLALDDNQLFVGEVSARCPGGQTGAFHAYNYTGATWTLTGSTCVPADASKRSSFGTSLAASKGTLAIGAPRESTDATGFDATLSPECPSASSCADNSGAVFLYREIDGTWQLTSHIKEATPEAGFGRSLTFNGPSLLVGATGSSETRMFKR